MKRVFAPGCALSIYKPHLAEKLHAVLNEHFGSVERLDTCCRNQPTLAEHTQLINVCPGCDRRYRENYPAATTISLWEVLAESRSFPFPDYQGLKMAIVDACPTRDQVRVHKAVRTLLGRMNVQLVEPANTGTNSTCCGDSFWGVLPVGQVKEQMALRAAQMPVDDVAVYCVSCSKAVHIGGKKPRYLVDLLFGEPTEPQTYEPEEWHRQLDKYIEQH